MLKNYTIIFIKFKILIIVFLSFISKLWTLNKWDEQCVRFGSNRTAKTFSIDSKQEKYEVNLGQDTDN